MRIVADNKEICDYIKSLPNIDLLNNDHNIYINDNIINIKSYDKSISIQLLNNDKDKRTGFDSYIYCDNNIDCIIDILNACYNIGLVSIDDEDVIKILNNKSFNYYKFFINEKINNNIIKELIKDINYKNKMVLFILYGGNDFSVKEYQIIIDALDGRKDNWLCVFIDNKLNDNRILSLFVEN